MHYIANSDYEETDCNPIHLAVGDAVKVSAKDQVWPGWVWAENASKATGYVPEHILSAQDDGTFIAHEAFDPTVLKIRNGDRLTSLKQIGGWHWCQNEPGNNGWVAGYLLRPLEF